MRETAMSRDMEMHHHTTTKPSRHHLEGWQSSGTTGMNSVRKYAAEQGIAEEAALAKGMEEPSVARWTMRSIARQGEAQRSQKSKEFVGKGAEVYTKA